MCVMNMTLGFVGYIPGKRCAPWASYAAAVEYADSDDNSAFCIRIQ